MKGKIYPDLKIPVEDTEKGFEIVELKLHTSELKYLRAELNQRDTIFSTSDHMYFRFLWRLGSKELKEKSGIDEEIEELLGVDNLRFST